MDENSYQEEVDSSMADITVKRNKSLSSSNKAELEKRIEING